MQTVFLNKITLPLIHSCPKYANIQEKKKTLCLA